MKLDSAAFESEQPHEAFDSQLSDQTTADSSGESESESSSDTSAPAGKVAKKKATKKASKKKTGAKKVAKKAAKKTTKKSAKKTSKKTTRVVGSGKNLVIVESPAKAKTINKYLGSGYVVKASVGHVRDLPKSKLGIDVENNFALQYMTIRGKKEVLDELRKVSRVAKKVYLATDPDREGEAIAWHLKQALDLNPEITSRVTFNEITKDAIKRAFDHPKEIEGNTVDAYQARRALDRLVGYSISPLLWRKIAKGLSAGRVQSVAQRLICEREGEINAFVAEEYWSISAYLMQHTIASGMSDEQRRQLQNIIGQLHGDVARNDEEDDRALDSEEEVEQEQTEEGDEPAKKPTLPQGVVRFDLKKWRGETPTIATAGDAEGIVSALQHSPFKVSMIQTRERRDKPKAPYITSTLQQAASIKLGFTARRTMRTAQRLYEGIDLGDEGSTGLITYMRTDSVHLSDFAIEDARSIIKASYGEAYMPETPVLYKTSSKAQAAHEAIRPTSALRTPDSVKEYLEADQYKLYSLIWERFIACQMTPAVYEVTTVEAEAGEGVFRVSGRRLKFDGHARVSGLKLESGEQLLPPYAEGETLDCAKVKGDQHFTSPPPRFSEASLVKTLEKLGIGRPSTYASIISTLVDRGYVKAESRRFFATELGLIVNELLVNNFSRIVDSEFTARMESQLDKIEEGKLDWVDVMANFYAIFKDELEDAEKKIEQIKGTPALTKEGAPVPCPLCTTNMVVRWSTNGKFFGCANFPECKGTLPLDAEGNPITLTKEDIECPECHKDMVVRMGKRGPFLGCSTFPACRGTRAIEATKSKEEKDAEQAFAGVRCNKCSAPMAVRVARGRPFLGCTAYPECKNAISLKKAEGLIAADGLVVDEELRQQQLAEIDNQRKAQESLRLEAQAG